MTSPRTVGPVAARFEGVERMAVLRGGGLGDVLFAVPALEALKEAYPGAELTLLGTPLHTALFDARPGPVDRVEVLPAVPGLRSGPEDPDALAEFLDRMRAQRYDLAVQLHGGGRQSNPFLLALRARHTIGTRTPDAQPLERTLPYLYYQHEVLRALEVVGLAGAEPTSLRPSLAVIDDDLAQARRALDASGLEEAWPRLVIHPGASDPRRHWAPAHFAEVARCAAEDGWSVVVVGDEAERGLAESIVRSAGAPEAVRALAGHLSLRGLIGVLARCDVFLGNDSGPRHLAEAVGTPTVGIYWVGNVINAGPLGRARHRLHIGWTTRCPTCDADLTDASPTAPDCRHVFGLNDAVRPQDVYADVRDLLATTTRA